MWSLNPFTVLHSNTDDSAAEPSNTGRPHPGPLARAANQRHRHLVTFNESACSDPGTVTVPEWVDAQANRNPGATAVRDGDVLLSYRSLCDRAEEVSRVLAREGVEIGDRVGLGLARSIDRYVGMLAILKAGAACVPFAPTEEGIRSLDGLSLSVLLTNTSTGNALSRVNSGAQIVYLDRADGGRGSRRSVQHVPSPDEWAWIQPGVGPQRGHFTGLTHRDLMRHVCWHRELSSLDAGARTLQVAPDESDLSVQEVMCTWCMGGCLDLGSSASSRGVDGLLDRISSASPHRLFLPANMLAPLARTAMDTGRAPTSLRDVTVVGGPVPLEPVVQAFVETVEPCVLNVLYRVPQGPIVTGYRRKTPISDGEYGPVLGRPLPGIRLYVLDPKRQLVSLGNEGEVYVGGLRSEAESQRIGGRSSGVEDPFSNEPHAVMHRTGVRARHRDDGCLVFVGYAPHGDGATGTGWTADASVRAAEA